MCFSDAYQLSEALWKDNVVGRHDLYVFASWGNKAKGVIVIADDPAKRIAIHNADTAVLLCIQPCNLPGCILAAIIDNYELKVFVGLRQNALNAFAQVGFSVVDRGQHRNEGLRI